MQWKRVDEERGRASAMFYNLGTIVQLATAYCFCDIDQRRLLLSLISPYVCQIRGSVHGCP